MKFTGTLARAAAIMVIAGTSVWGQSKPDLSSELKELRESIESLRAEYKALQKDLTYIKLVVTGRQPPLEDVTIDLTDAPSRGNQAAQVTLVEFSDYQCPFCGQFTREALPQVLAEYVNSGKIRYVFRDFPLEGLHPDATKAAEAAHCAGEQNKYWSMHDRLFENQEKLGIPDLRAYASDLGLDCREVQRLPGWK